MAEEKIYTVPLGKAYDYIRTKRTRRAVVLVQQFIARHSKVALKNVRVSNALNSVLWARSIQKPPRKIKIKVAKEGDIAKAYLVDEQVKKPEVEKEEKIETKAEAKAETEKKPEKKAEAAAKPEAAKKPKAAEAQDTHAGRSPAGRM